VAESSKTQILVSTLTNHNLRKIWGFFGPFATDNFTYLPSSFRNFAHAHCVDKQNKINKFGA